MPDIDSSETAATVTDDQFGQANFKNFTPTPISPEATATNPALEPNSASASPQQELAPRLDDNQFKEIARLPLDLAQGFLFALFPFLRPEPQDPAELTARKQTHLQRYDQLNQAQKEVFLHRAQEQQLKQQQLARQQQAQQEAVAAQTLPVHSPQGKQTGAADPNAHSQKARTQQLLQRQRTANADRTAGAD